MNTVRLLKGCRRGAEIRLGNSFCLEGVKGGAQLKGHKSPCCPLASPTIVISRYTSAGGYFRSKSVSAIFVSPGSGAGLLKIVLGTLDFLCSNRGVYLDGLLIFFFFSF